MRYKGKFKQYERNIELMQNTPKEDITEVARMVCGTINKYTKNLQTSWWTDEITRVVRKQKEKWKRYLVQKKKSTVSYEEYKLEWILGPRHQTQNKVLR